LAARQGDWLGPIKLNLKMPQTYGYGRLPLFSIVNKQMPAEADTRIRERAERAILNSLIEHGK
jgi:hypothetical protein